VVPSPESKALTEPEGWVKSSSKRARPIAIVAKWVSQPSTFGCKDATVDEKIDSGQRPEVDDDTMPEPERAEASSRPRRWRLRWVFTRRLCFGGLAGALVFFCLSMTPSLVPREVLMQGVVSGVSVAIGYGFGSLLSSGIRKLIRREPSATFKSRAWWILAGSTLVMGGLYLYFGSAWQEDIRRVMEMEQFRAYDWVSVVLITLIIAAVLLVVARLVRGLAKSLIRLGDRFMPHSLTVNVSVVLVALLVAGFAQGVLFNGMVTTINSTYSLNDRDTNPWISQPTSELRSGGPDSVVDWDTLGTKGRDFTGIGGGPTTEQIEAFNGETATEPIRIYVGLKSADEVRDRVDLAMQELERTGAFERSVLIVNTTTGTGWVDENVVDSVEFMHRGDTAQVAMQYSYLPSWVSFLVDLSKASEAGEQLITAVSDRISQMPPEDRPTLLVFGESLGSYGTESAFTSPENMLSNVDGAMLVGPTFANPLHGELTSERDEGSPAWRPAVDGGESFHFAVAPEDLTDSSLYSSGTEWGPSRVVYLQNSSDPITYFNPDLIWSSPAWLQGERGPDVSADMTWMPVVSFFQVAADMAFAMSVPAGHGHSYGSNVVEGWAQLSAPEGWTSEDTAALRELIDQRAEERTERKEAAS
jgi:uncharacterized membrane protein